MELYVVMWESWDGVECGGGDLYMSLDFDKAALWLQNKIESETRFSYDWDDDNEMWISRYEHGWEKMYIDIRELDKELF